MLDFWKLRILNKNFKIAFLIGTSLALLHIFQRIFPLSLKKDIIFTPYTTWIGIDSFNPISFLYFFLVPVIASLPCATVYKEDINNGTFPNIIIRTNKTKYFSTLYLYSFLVGGVTILIPLFLNFILSFMFLPNIYPDEVINMNLSMFEYSAFFVDLFYSNTILHVLLTLIICFLFGGVFAVFSLSLSFYVKQIFVIFLGSFLLQIVLMIINLLFKIPLAPIFYISEFHIYGNARLSISLCILCLICLASLIMYSYGVKKNALP